MLTDYTVACPRAGCHWSGRLLPSRNRDAWRAAVPTTSTIYFRCPRCQGEFRARRVGEDALALPVEEALKLTEA